MECLTHLAVYSVKLNQDTGRRLVVGQENGADSGLTPEDVKDALRVDRLAGLDIDLGDVDAEGAGDLSHAFAEIAHAGNQQALTRAERVGDERLESARARGGQDYHVVLRLKRPLQPIHTLAQDRRELGAAVSDHVAGECLADGGRQRGWSRRTQVLGAHTPATIAEIYSAKWRVTRSTPCSIATGTLPPLGSS